MAAFRCWWAAPCSISRRCWRAFSAAFRRSHHSGWHREDAAASAGRRCDELVRIDPVAGARITPAIPSACRALRGFHIGGKTLTELTQVQGGAAYRALQFAIAPRDRAVLHQRIEQRFDKMLGSGFEQEVRALCEAGISPGSSLHSLRGIPPNVGLPGGEVEYDEMRYRGIVATRQLAKRPDDLVARLA